MGSYSIEEITLDEATGKKTGRRKIPQGEDTKMEAHEEEDHGEEEEKGGNTKIREKY